MLESTSPDREPGALFACVPNRVGADARGRVPLTLHAGSPIEWFAQWRTDRFGRRGPGYKQFKAGFARQMFALVERHYPGFGATLGGFVTSSPLTNMHFNGAVDGSSYGIYHSMETTGPRALGPRTRVRNLLLAGQNYLFPGLLGAAVSALRTSGHMMGIKSVLRDLEKRVEKRVEKQVPTPSRRSGHA
jgi:phytoene dehydrogenase-like protein